MRLLSFWRSLKYKIKRHTTIKPRTLNHGYCDTVELMPHLMFELLTRYIEEEANSIDWDKHFEYSGKDTRGEMQELYDWWQRADEFEEVRDILFKEMDKYQPAKWFNEDGFFDPRWDGGKDIYDRLSSAVDKLEDDRENELNINLHRLLEIRTYLWS